VNPIKELRKSLGPECDWLTDEGVVRQACGEIEAHRKYLHALHPFAKPNLSLEDDLLRIVDLLKSTRQTGHVARLLKRVEISKSGWGGTLPNGQIVDRREYPEAFPIAKNSMFGIPEPNVNNERRQEPPERKP
jgi:hypothetical protein